MDTALLEQDLYQYCSLNSINESGQVQNTCDMVHRNGVHTDQFGFIPKGPLEVYDGNPVPWNSVPDIIRTHLMCGIPNYLGCTISVLSNLKCQK